MSDLLAYEAASRAILARHLQTGIENAAWVDHDEVSLDAHRRLAGRFDQAPVRKANRIVGSVLTKDLLAQESRVGDVMAPLDEDIIESADAPVGDVIRGLMPDRALLFVVDGHRISGFITPSDLNKHPARSHFYLLLADLEMTLAEAVLPLCQDSVRHPASFDY